MSKRHGVDPAKARNEILADWREAYGGKGGTTFKKAILIASPALWGLLWLFSVRTLAQGEPPETTSGELKAASKTLPVKPGPDHGPQAKESDPSGEKSEKKESRGSIVIAPIPISSPAIGTGMVLAGGYIFPFRKSDTVSPPSVIGGAGLYTDNGSRGFAMAGEFYLKQNTYHLTSVFFHGNINYDFYGVGTAAGDAGLKLPLKQAGQAFLGEFLYRIGRKFFLGPRFLTGSSEITLRTSQQRPVPRPPNLGIQTTLTALGVRLNRDTRPNRFYPTQGTLLDFTSTFFSEGLGSKYSFQSYRLTFNYYHSFTEKQVLAYNLFTCATGGAPPFYGECIYGTNNELRGYIGGQYIDRRMVATQLEYRLALPWRLGLVAFGGLGEVAPSLGEFRYRNILPAAGGGLRFKLSSKYNVNLRADIAQGKDGHTFGMGLGEAF